MYNPIFFLFQQFCLRFIQLSAILLQ